MTYRVPTFQVAADAPLACRIAMKQAHVAHYEALLGRASGRWYDQGRRYLAQLREELADLEAQAHPAHATPSPAGP